MRSYLVLTLTIFACRGEPMAPEPTPCPEGTTRGHYSRTDSTGVIVEEWIRCLTPEQVDSVYRALLWRRAQRERYG